MNPTYFTDMVQEIARLYKTPGWGAWARHRAQELQDEPSGAYAGLVEAVRSHLASLNDQQKSGG